MTTHNVHRHDVERPMGFRQPLSGVVENPISSRDIRCFHSDTFSSTQFCELNLFAISTDSCHIYLSVRCESRIEKEQWLPSQWSPSIKVTFKKNASGCLTVSTLFPPLLSTWTNHRCSIDTWTTASSGLEDGQSKAVDLRNTGELDLDNTSERTCFFESPYPSYPV